MFSDIKFFPLFVIVGFLLLNITAAFSQQSGNANFLAARAYDGGVGFATGDFNGDGKLDVASAAIDRLNLSLGSGGGIFNQATTVFNCASFSSTAIRQPLAGDFNGDGKTDLAAWIADNSCGGGTGLRALMLLPGNGSGGFAAPIFTTVSNFFFIPDQFLAADFNGDGRTDVAIGSSWSITDGDKVGVFLSSGGGFAAPVVYNLGGQAFYTLTVGDFNNDNRADLIYARRSPTNLMIMPNNGDGTFAAPQTINSNVFVGALATGDFNGDGNLDFVAATDRDFNPTIQTWLGGGNNAFTAGASYTFTISSRVGGFLSGDFDRNSKLDLALSFSGRTFVLRGGGNGAFVEDELYAVGGARLFKGDFNGDGWLDLATAQTLAIPDSGSPSDASSEFAVLLNARTGKFIAAPHFESPFFGGNEIITADFNNDGLRDLAVTGDAAQGEIGLILQEPGAAFDRAARRPIKFESARRGLGIVPRTIAAGDFNADGKTDVVVAGRATPGITENVIVARNDGAGNLTLFSTLSLGGIITKVVAADFNADGKLDLAFSQEREVGTTTFSALFVAFGAGNGTFAAPVSYLPGVIGNSLATGDFNGDGKADLAVARSGDGKVSVLLNNGSGGFSVNANNDLSFAAAEIAAADLHGDGKTDLIVSSVGHPVPNAARIGVFAGVGDGTFAPAVNYSTNSRYNQRLTVDDFNGDGKPDVAATSSGVITVLENNGGGALTRKTLWATMGGLQDIVSGDLDGDGKIDLITTSHINNFFSIGVLPNVTVPTINRPALFDFDGDGKADLSVFRPSNGAWYLQQSANGFTALAFGSAADRIVPADYDGDGKTDVAVYRGGIWYLQRSQSGFNGVSFGTSSDVPVPADFDGDGKSELAVYRASNGTWYIYNLATNQTNAVQFGAGEDKPVPADYDGDGKADVAVFRPSNGTWYLQRSNLGFTGIAFGEATDKPVPADYDGDGKTDVAVFRPSNGAWYLQRSGLGFTGLQFGAATDLPVAADYDGDGKADVAVFRPSNGTWYLQRSQAGFNGAAFGASEDKPVPNAFVP